MILNCLRWRRALSYGAAALLLLFRKKLEQPGEEVEV